MLTVSNYHYIREDFSAPFSSIFGVTPKQFREQLEKLAKLGEFISQEELLKFRDKPLDRNYVLITFDDGLKEQYQLAKPILDEMGIPFIFFINTSNFEEKQVSLVHKIHLLRSQISSEELLKELQKSCQVTLTPKEKQMAIEHYNYDSEATAELKYLLNLKISVPEQKALAEPLFAREFGEEEVVQDLYFDEDMLQELNRQQVLASHSHQHVPLGQLEPEELRGELKRSQVFFKKNFGKPAKIISYPYGSFAASTGISEEVERAGFKLGFTMERAVNKSMEHPYLLSRFDCNDLPGGKNNLFKQSGLYADPPLRTWYQHEAGFTYKR